uniref:Uncharacterized protein n=1 Tax=Spongospora subterranea TaxID=70186 RepID=A0A0H5QVS1_9EUKA|eukprot:CRZ06015.1 hypothetical protein [Spongospora subterranea]
MPGLITHLPQIAYLYRPVQVKVAFVITGVKRSQNRSEDCETVVLWIKSQQQSLLLGLEYFFQRQVCQGDSVVVFLSLQGRKIRSTLVVLAKATPSPPSNARRVTNRPFN